VLSTLKPGPVFSGHRVVCCKTTLLIRVLSQDRLPPTDAGRGSTGDTLLGSCVSVRPARTIGCVPHRACGSAPPNGRALQHAAAILGLAPSARLDRQVAMVDDSAVVRQAFQHLLAGDPDITLMGSAPNPLLAGRHPQEPARRAAARHRDAGHGRADLPAPDDGGIPHPHRDLLDADHPRQQGGAGGAGRRRGGHGGQAAAGAQAVPGGVAPRAGADAQERGTHPRRGPVQRPARGRPRRSGCPRPRGHRWPACMRWR
jgi:hypothetical protein